jgi:hypothetical protein
MGRMENSYNVMYACNEEMDKKGWKDDSPKVPRAKQSTSKKGNMDKGKQ